MHGDLVNTTVIWNGTAEPDRRYRAIAWVDRPSYVLEPLDGGPRVVVQQERVESAEPKQVPASALGEFRRIYESTNESHVLVPAIDVLLKAIDEANQ